MEEIKKETPFGEARRVLIFLPSLRLCAITASVNTANKILCGDSGKEGVNVRLMDALNGRQYTHKGFHLRYENPEVQLEYDDIGILTLNQYDYLCGEKRIYPPAKYVKDKSRRMVKKYKKKKLLENKNGK